MIALVDLFNSFDATPAHFDCACTNQTSTIQPNCSWVSAYCVYFVPSGSPTAPVIDSNAPRARAKAWQSSETEYIGLSKGWSNPAEGYPTADAGEALTDALLDVLDTHPNLQCNQGVTVPPVVMVPGLTSANINYKLDDSEPPIWAFWCDKTTSGQWMPLWPIPDGVMSDTKKFICWTSTIEVKFDKGANTFTALRKNEETELVDFGNFTGG